MVKLAAITAVLILSSCSVIDPLVKRSGEQVAKGVDKYCEEVDVKFREQFRRDVNPTPKGNCGVVWCKSRGDVMPDLNQECAVP